MFDDSIYYRLDLLFQLEITFTNLVDPPVDVFYQSLLDSFV